MKKTKIKKRMKRKKKKKEENKDIKERENKNEKIEPANNNDKRDKKEEIKEEKEKKEKTYLIPIEEDAFDDLNEWLVLYHGVRPKKVFKRDKNTQEKNYYLKLSVSQLQSFHYQKYRLSLIALLLKHNLFITEKKYIVYHPFKYSIQIKNYKTNKEYDDLDKSIMNLNILSPSDYYLYEYKKNYYYLHFFNKELGKKVFPIMQEKHY